MAEYKDMTNYRELFDEEYKKTRKLISQGETHLDNLAEGFTEADMVIRKIPAADVVSRGVFEQVKWERDIAMEQLNDHKIPFGCIAPDVVEVVRCKDCKHLEIDKGWQGGRACLMRGGDTGWCHDNDFCSYGERKEV